MNRTEYKLSRRQALLDSAIAMTKAAQRDLEEADAWVNDNSSWQVQEKLMELVQLIKALGGEDEL